MKVDYSLCFINSVINELQMGQGHGDGSYITLPNLFGITKPFTSIEIPYFELSKTSSKYFWKKFWKFFNESFRVATT